MKFLILILTAVFLTNPLPAAAQSSQALIAKGDLSRARFANEEALSQYRQAVKTEPENALAAIRLAQALVDAGEDMHSSGSAAYYSEAAKLAVAITSSNPGIAEGHYLLALSSYRLATISSGGGEKAGLARTIEQSLVKSLILDTDHARARALLGAFYREIASLPWASRMFARFFLGGLPEGSYEDSLRQLKKSRKLAPNFAFGRLEMGKTLEAMGMRDKAAAEYKLTITLPITDHLDLKYIEEARARLKLLGND